MSARKRPTFGDFLEVDLGDSGFAYLRYEGRTQDDTFDVVAVLKNPQRERIPVSRLAQLPTKYLFSSLFYVLAQHGSFSLIAGTPLEKKYFGGRKRTSHGWHVQLGPESLVVSNLDLEMVQLPILEALPADVVRGRLLTGWSPADDTATSVEMFAEYGRKLAETRRAEKREQRSLWSTVTVFVDVPGNVDDINVSELVGELTSRGFGVTKSANEDGSAELAVRRSKTFANAGDFGSYVIDTEDEVKSIAGPRGGIVSGNELSS